VFSIALLRKGRCRCRDPPQAERLLQNEFFMQNIGFCLKTAYYVLINFSILQQPLFYVSNMLLDSEEIRKHSKNDEKTESSL